jgi:hypothetical protein
MATLAVLLEDRQHVFAERDACGRRLRLRPGRSGASEQKDGDGPDWKEGPRIHAQLLKLLTNDAES